MRTVIFWWDLSGSAQTIESLRTYLPDESVAAFAGVPGLRFKMWIADPQTNRNRLAVRLVPVMTGTSRTNDDILAVAGGFGR